MCTVHAIRLENSLPEMCVRHYSLIEGADCNPATACFAVCSLYEAALADTNLW